jgi:hypothetical protein
MKKPRFVRGFFHRSATAGPSTPFVAKSAPNSAQDDSDFSYTNICDATLADALDDY